MRPFPHSLCGCAKLLECGARRSGCSKRPRYASHDDIEESTYQLNSLLIPSALLGGFGMQEFFSSPDCWHQATSAGGVPGRLCIGGLPCVDAYGGSVATLQGLCAASTVSLGIGVALLLAVVMMASVLMNVISAPPGTPTLDSDRKVFRCTEILFYIGLFLLLVAIGLRAASTLHNLNHGLSVLVISVVVLTAVVGVLLFLVFGVRMGLCMTDMDLKHSHYRRSSTHTVCKCVTCTKARANCNCEKCYDKRVSNILDACIHIEA